MLDGAHIVAVGGELQFQGKAVPGLAERDGQVELRAGDIIADETGAAGAERNLRVHRSAVRERHEHCLKHRMATGYAFLPQRRHDIVERDVRMGERLGVTVAHLSEPVGETRVPREPCAQRDRVDEESNGFLEGDIITSCRDGSEHEIRTGTQTAQQGRESGVHDHEHGGSLTAGQGTQALQCGHRHLVTNHPGGSSRPPCRRARGQA